MAALTTIRSSRAATESLRASHTAKSAAPATKKWSSGSRSQRRERGARGHGVYQIGEVYARSCCTIGTSGGSLIPKYLAS